MRNPDRRAVCGREVEREREREKRECGQKTTAKEISSSDELKQRQYKINASRADGDIGPVIFPQPDRTFKIAHNIAGSCFFAPHNQ